MGRVRTTSNRGFRRVRRGGRELDSLCAVPQVEVGVLSRSPACSDWSLVGSVSSCGHRILTHHESAGDESLDRKAFDLELARNLSGNTSELEFAESSEVVHQNNDLILISATKRNVAPVFILGRDYYRDELVDELVHRWDWGYPLVSCFVVDSHTDFNFITGEVVFRRDSAGNLKSEDEMLKDP